MNSTTARSTRLYTTLQLLMLAGSSWALSACVGAYIPMGAEEDKKDNKKDESTEEETTENNPNDPNSDPQGTNEGDNKGDSFGPNSSNSAGSQSDDDATNTKDKGTENNDSSDVDTGESSEEKKPNGPLEIRLSFDSILSVPANWRVNASMVRIGDSVLEVSLLGELLDTTPVLDGENLSIKLPDPPDEFLKDGKVTIFLTVYADLTGDKKLSQQDTYVATAINHLLFEKVGNYTSWRYFDREKLAYPSAVGATLPMTRIDRSPQVLVDFGGKIDAVPNNIQAIALLSGNETQDLKNEFMKAERAVDFSISDAKSTDYLWEHTVTQPMKPERFNPLFAGINRHGSEWLTGYSQPVGFRPGPPVNPNSLFIANLCSGFRAIAMLWIEPKNWLLSAVGAYTVAYYDLMPGWNFLSYDLRNPNDPPITLRDDERRNLHVSPRCD